MLTDGHTSADADEDPGRWTDASVLGDRYLEALHETALDLLHRREVSDLLETILARAGAIAGTGHGYIFLLDDDERYIRGEIVSGTFETELGSRLERGDGLVGKVWASGRPILIEDYDRWAGRSSGYPTGRISSGIGVPLVSSGGDTVGVIGLAHTEAGVSFSPQDLDRVTAFAQLASVALENARLHEEARHEIEERVRAEEALRQTEENYRRLVELSPDGIAVHADGRVVFANPAAAAILGSGDASDLVGRSTIEFVHPRSRAVVTERMRRMLEHDTSVPLVEETFLRVDASSVEVEVAASPLTFEGDRAVQVVFRDISERKRAEAALRAAEAKYRNLVELLPVVAYVFPDPHRPEALPADYASPRIEEFLGVTPDQWLAGPDAWQQAVDHDHVEEAVEAWARSVETGEPFIVEYRATGSDGTQRWIRDEAYPVCDESGTRLYWQGIMTDISEHRRAEEALKASFEHEREVSRQLRTLDEMKNTFLAAVSHELRTPLSAILGIALTLEREEVALDPADARELLGRLAANARKLNRLLADLLDLDRLGRGIVEPRRRPTDVAALVRQVVENADPISDRTIRLDLQEVEANLDAPKVERIVENLLVNAVRHTPDGSDITVWVRRGDGGVTIGVDDDGPGIPEDLRGAVFEPFRQVPSRRSHAPGVGIGLSLVSRFAELHGGRAWVEERSGGGSSFRVWLPDADG